MPKERDYHAEYVAREDRARDRGFRSYWDERQYAKEHKGQIAKGKSAVKERTAAGGYTYDPQQAVAYWTSIGQFIGIDPNEVTGEIRHAAVRYYVEWEGMSLDQAMDAMRELYGDSGQAQRKR